MTRKTREDVQAEIDRKLRGLNELPIGKLQELMLMLDALCVGYEDIRVSARRRIRERLLVDLPDLPQHTFRGRDPVFAGPGLSRPASPGANPLLSSGDFFLEPRRITKKMEMAFTAELGAGEHTIERYPKHIFRALHIVVPDEASTDGDMLNITVGRHPQFGNDAPRPLSLYCPARWADESLMKRADISIDTATPAVKIVLHIRLNRPLRFCAILYGICEYSPDLVADAETSR